MNRSFDVLIVGGGLVGISLALALANQPIKIGIVEAKDPASLLAGDDDRALALALGGCRIFETMGLWSKIKNKATPIEQIHVSDRGRFGATRFSAAEQGFPAFGYVVSAHALMQILNKELQAHPHIAWIAPAKLQKLHYQNDHHTVTLQSQNEPQQLTAQLIIGADGSHSAVRNFLKLPVDTWDYGQSAIFTRVTLTRSHHNIAYERFTETGPLAMLPLADQQSAVVWTVPSEKADEFVQMDDAVFLTQLQKKFGYRLGRLHQIEKRRVFPLHLLQCKQPIAPGAVLIGNAAHTLHPIAAQGFNLGLRDAAILAQIITDAAAAKQNLGALTLLKKYQQWRHNDQRQIVRFTHGIVRLFSNEIFPLTIARNLGLLGLDVAPFAKQFFTRRTMGLAGRLSKLACGVGL